MARRRGLARIIVLAAVFVFVLYRYNPFSDNPVRRFRIPLRKFGPIEFVPSSYDWADFEHHHPRPAAKMVRLPPADRQRHVPRVQHDFAGDKVVPLHVEMAEARLTAVRAAIKKSWDGYVKEAWGLDELRPVEGGGRDTFGGYGATLVDSLDTLWIAGLRSEFIDAVREACRIDFSATSSTSLNVFETTIRFLGGLLSAHDLSGEKALLLKARELGDLLYAAFDTPNRIPGFWFDFEDARHGNQFAGVDTPSASPASLSLEFTRLAQLTGDHKYYDAVDTISRYLERTQNHTRMPGIWPTIMNFRGGDEDEDVMPQHYTEFTLGALADSMFEYLPKMHALLAGADPKYEAMYRTAMAVVEKYLLFRPMVPPTSSDGAGSGSGSSSKKTGASEIPDILFAVSATAGRDDEPPQSSQDSQHLSCFAGGMFALGGRLLDEPRHVAIGEKLARGCAWGYKSFPTGLLPEIFGLAACPKASTAAPSEPCAWDEEAWKNQVKAWGGSSGQEVAEGKAKRTIPRGFTDVRDARYILRPEAIESLFVLYRVTGKEELREMAWQMFLDIQVATSTHLANSAIDDVTVTGQTNKVDSMESFWLGETLKYFYLIFSKPDVISLDEWVLNTEAHPLRRPKRTAAV
ncbi:endoplasmic reticulum mannosyl-oligosaccharide 1,2-alpha-mannosidase [Magnaporthiopsis poae ATCC 64411]|uniref:alpha-1,2-Mannosidase n=1 Tax=Magnaporthiopsis poae (strain ATCC 64411 / 73-15) TaxID=644358 RepID=A0A0C4DPS0_MAGP6|nr:endoplasmic reticulum mannosyl-oligosaccharide 1,2-alpha-mannosidase [Magnaporthiopsis poae ATCC 64411]